MAHRIARWLRDEDAWSEVVNYALTVGRRSRRRGCLATLAAFWPHKDAQRCRLLRITAAARLSPSNRCTYTSLVTAMLAWPSTSETTCSGVPWAKLATRRYAAGHESGNDRSGQLGCGRA
jgi:hypothetical protein